MLVMRLETIALNIEKPYIIFDDTIVHLPIVAPSAVIRLMHFRASWLPASSDAVPTVLESPVCGIILIHGGHSLIGGGESGITLDSKIKKLYVLILCPLLLFIYLPNLTTKYPPICPPIHPSI